MSLINLWNAIKSTNICIMGAQSKKRERGRKNIWRNTAQKSPQFYERHDESIHPRSSKNPKEEKLQEIHIKTCYNQTVKSQTQSPENSKREAICYVQ